MSCALSSPACHDADALPISWSDAVKAGMDLALSVPLLTLGLPIVAVAALAVRCTSRGPSFYWQTRAGRFGREFLIVKLRTMYHDCEKESGAQWCKPRDPRVTPLGRFLRRTHIDELPQLWNVLRGEMSLIGPRPERPEIIGDLERDLPGYRDRLEVKPGITGLAQVQLPPDETTECVWRKLHYDRCYVAQRGLWLDSRIAIATAAYLVGLPRLWIARALRLPRPDVPVRFAAMPARHAMHEGAMSTVDSAYDAI